MKRKFANRPNWNRIIKKRYEQKYINDVVFNGYVTCLYLDKVREPLIVAYGEEEVCIVDEGFKWLMFFPINEHFSLTVMINQQSEIVQWYFDIVKRNELTDEQIPVSYDLYLDCVLLLNGNSFVLDEEELTNALNDGFISIEDYKLAKYEAEQLMKSIKSGTNELINRSKEYMELFQI